jgi:hypothetical protein
MIKIAGNIEILCGALADQAAREVERSGIFTRKLLEMLSQPHEPPLLTLPFDLDAWHRMLPANLLDDGVRVLGTRDVLGAVSEEHEAGRAAPTQSESQSTEAASGDETERSVTGERAERSDQRRRQQSAA